MVLGYIAGGIVFVLTGFGIYYRYKKKENKIEDLETGLELAEKDLGKESDILEITKGLTNRTYFDEEERVKFLRELELMIEKTIEEWNSLFGSREVIEHIEKVSIHELKDVKKQERIPLPENMKKVLREKGISLSIKPAVKDYLVKNGFDPDYGARPVKRLIQKVIVDALADKIIRGTVRDGQKINISLREQNRVEISV